MKKLLFLISFLCVANLATAKISSDKTDEDGTRSIYTEQELVRGSLSDRTLTYISLSRFESQKLDTVLWDIHIQLRDYVSYTIPKGSLLLIKLEDDEVIELRQQKSTDLTDDPIGTWNSYYSMSFHDMTAYYPVTEEQLKTIIRLGVKKIRIERQALEPLDVEYRKDKIGEYLKTSYFEILKSLRKRTDIRANF